MICNLRIHTALRGHITYLKRVYLTVPFKVADITENKQERKLNLVIMSASPGILSKDHYEIEIKVDDGCFLQLQTQAYQRLFNMQHEATQNQVVRVGEGATLIYIPFPTVPHQNAHFSSHTHIHMQQTGCLIWGEILTCGRKLNGEQFLYRLYHNTTDVYKNDQLVIRENQYVEPATMDLMAMGQLEGYTHQGTLTYLHHDADMEWCKTKIIELLQKEKEIVFGVSLTPTNGLIIRVLGQRAEQMYKCFNEIAELVPHLIPLKEPAYV
jgi:urease accessory protein